MICRSAQLVGFTLAGLVACQAPAPSVRSPDVSHVKAPLPEPPALQPPPAVPTSSPPAGGETQDAVPITPPVLVVAPAPPKPVCVVLSVGAEQGLAHIGVVDALRERGVKVDCVVGTSMGALVGGLYASAPQADLGRRYREVFERYAGQGSVSASETASNLLFAAASAVGAAKGWDRLHNVLTAYLGGQRIEALPVPFRTVHQLLTATGAQSQTVRGGPLAEEIAASIANPLIFPGIPIQQGTRLDPGLDRVSSVPLQTACEEFPGHQFVVSNVTPNPVFFSANMDCPFQELRIAPGAVDRSRALRALEPEFGQLVRAGFRAAVERLDWKTLPQGLAPTRPLEFVRVTLTVEVATQQPTGESWDAFGNEPDIVADLRVLACPGCEPRGSSATETRHFETSDSRKLLHDWGVLALRPGFVLRTQLSDADVDGDDSIGVFDVIYDSAVTERMVQGAWGKAWLRFGRGR